MAVIGSIRKRSGLLILVIGGALFAFIIGEFLNSSLGRSSSQISEVGDIAGSSISINEFSSRMQEVKTQYEEYGATGNSDRDYRRIAWNELVREKVYLRQIDDAGIQVTKDELDDMMYGPGVIDEFKNNEQFQTNGVFNPDLLRDFYARVFGSRAQQDQSLGDMLYRRELSRIANNRKAEKYEALLKKGLYATRVEGKEEYDAAQATMDLSFVFKNYNTIPDSTIQVSDGDIKSYFNAHKDESKYQQQEGRSVIYVSFDAKASEADKAELSASLAKVGTDFGNAQNDSLFVVQNSASRSYTNLYYNENVTDQYIDKGLGEEAKSFLTNGSKGEVSAPIANNVGDQMNIYKVTDKVQMPDSVQARHILIAYAGAERADPSVTRQPLEAKTLADSLLEVLENDKSKYDEIARSMSDGPSKTKGGDLGWFVPGTMAFAFNEYCFFNKKGDMALVPTSFGFHIIDITDQSSTTKPTARYAQITKLIKPSTDTRNGAYDLASRFMFDTKNGNEEAFRAKAEEMGYAIQEAPKMGTNTRILPGVTGSENLVYWAFREGTEQGNVSEPYEAESEYLVGMLTEVIPKGTPIFAHVKDIMKQEVLKEKKAAIIQEEWQGAQTLEDIADLEGTQVKQGSQVKFSTSSIANLGPEPDVIGTLAGSDEGTIWRINGVEGVAAVRLDAITGQADGSENFISYQTTAKNSYQNGVPSRLIGALNKYFEVEDGLHKF
ncbi:MAG: hypothetical protein HKN39_07915 [Flavobacteriales bacterium]|nr:hypothetical protein [Flavobacteriales bacterium]